MNYPSLPERASGKSQRSIFVSCLKGTAAAAGSALVLISVTALILSKSSNPYALLTPAGIILLYFSAAVGGFASYRFQRDSALLSGLLSGGMLTVISIACSLFYLGFGEYSVGFGFPITLLLKCGTAVFSIIGALISANRKAQRKSRRKRKVR